MVRNATPGLCFIWESVILSSSDFGEETGTMGKGTMFSLSVVGLDILRRLDDVFGGGDLIASGESLEGCASADGFRTLKGGEGRSLSDSVSESTCML